MIALAGEQSGELLGGGDVEGLTHSVLVYPAVVTASGHPFGWGNNS